ncbi:MAG: APC family permease [Oscillospiraceae bacterium]|jgi:amino acid transporter|nr:APC family permease [Oscillospiraceae bacterium]MDD3260534.1 APC family permease [Oscillospiraceae bacterium]
MEKSKFKKVLNEKDILVIAFGAMIGWAWVVSTGDWIKNAGTIGTILAFLLGGIMVYFVGLTYAELTPAMPQCGGEHVFSYKALGPTASFICTWEIILGYASVAAFEAVAFPTVLTWLIPNFLQGYMYTIGGFKVYASWVAVAVVVALLITLLNIVGTKTAAVVQSVLTAVIAAAGILLVVGSLKSGNISLVKSTAFASQTGSKYSNFGGILTIAVMTPFYFVGFDVIPQAAEEVDVPYKKLGRIMLLSIVLALVFYAAIVFAVGYVLPLSKMSEGSLPSADAIQLAFHSSAMAKVLIIGGMSGIITSWNSFLIGGSRAAYSMAESKMLPAWFGKLHKKYKTPVNAILFIGAITVLAPFFGRKMLTWIVDAGSLAVCIAYMMVALSFLVLRYKAPEMNRPYKVKHGKLVGVIAVVMASFFIVLYVVPLPFASSALVWQEWLWFGVWAACGVFFYFHCKSVYGEKFASHVDVELDASLM